MRTIPQPVYKSLFLLIVSALLFSACSMPAFPTAEQQAATQQPAATPTALAQTFAPAVVETLPLAGSRIGLQEEITFYFNQPMDRASVEAAWNADPALGGEFFWADDATVTFKPSGTLEAGASLKLGVNAGARAANGSALAEAVSYTYQAAASLHPVQFLPNDGDVDISVDAAIVVAFDQPVVALGADPASQPAAFSLEPAAQGRGEWLNTSTYIFYPDPALAGGETYHALLNAELMSVAGTAFAQDAATPNAWSFTTAKPRLLKISPSTEIPLPLDLELTLTFNQPMDRASLEANFFFQDASAPLAGSFEWAEDSRSVTFIPNENLARNTSYWLKLGAAAQALGGTPLGTNADVEMISALDFDVVSTDPAQEGMTNQWGNGHIYFSSFIEDGIDIEDYLTITPDAYFSANAYENAIHFNGDFDGGTRYTLTVSSNLKDEWGGALGDSYDYVFTMPVPEPHITYPYLGSSLYFTAAENPAFYIQSTNIPTADVTLATVPLDDFYRLFGPDGYTEREVYQPALPDVWQQPLNTVDNRSETIALPLAKAEEELTPGIYYLRIWQAGAEGGDAPVYVVSSHVNMVFKLGATDALVWATDLRTGLPLVDETVSIYDETGTLLASGQTDVNGMWHGEIPAQEDSYQNFYAVTRQPGDDLFGFGASMWGDDISPWRFGLSMDRLPPHTQVYLYTDRPIYRPGQTVYFKAVVRDAYDGRYQDSDLTSLPLTVSDGWGENIQSLNPALSAYGTANGSFTLAEDAVSGYYSFNNPDLEFSAYFQVAEYRKPEINLEMNLTPADAKEGDTLHADISARYYFDAAASDLPIQWTLYDEGAYFPISGYRVGDLDLGWMRGFYSTSYYGDFVASGEGKTNADGILAFDLSGLDLGEGTRELTLEITAQDESGQQISARESIQVHPEDYYIGIRADQWMGREETEMGFDILTVDWNGEPRADLNLHADFKQVTWERQDADNPYEPPTFLPTYTPVSDADFVTGADGAARLSFTPPTPGTYVLEVSGGKASTQILLWVTGVEKAILPNLPKQHIRLTADKDSYQPGDTAEIFIPNPIEETTYALITIERGTIHKVEIMAVEPGGKTYAVPLTDDDAPTVYVSAVLLGGKDYRVGYVELDVNPIAQFLNINLTSQPTRSEPGGEVTFGIQVTDSQGAPVQGEFSLAVIDLAALALADPNSEPIDEAFYGTAKISVRTTLALAGDSAYGVFLDGGLGGMGGGGGGAPAVVRENFPDTAYWNAQIVTDANGQAQVSMKLPDNLTTWQVDLRGLTTDTRIGSAEMQIVSTKDVLIRPVTPRFLVVGDHVEMAAIVHNNTTQELSGRVSLQAIGFLLDDPNAIEQEVSIPANGRVKVSWWGTAQDAETAELIFNANFGDYSDMTRPTWGSLPVLRYTSPQSFVTAGTVESAGTLTEAISLPRSFVPSGGRLEVELDASLAAAILDGLEAIPEPPVYASSEAILSYLLPNVEMYQALQAAGLDDPELKARLEEALNIGVKRLLARQTENYGWGWYGTTASESYGIGAQASPSLGGGGLPDDPYLSAYILYGLWRANQAGVYIDETVFINAREYLHTASLRYIELADPMTWEKDRLVFMQFVMQMTGGADAVAVDQLDLWKDGLSPWAQALLALTLESRTAGDARARSLLANLETSARRSASGAHWESDASQWRNPATPNYTTATVIYALAQFDATSPLLQDATRYLAAHRNIHGYWSSTYENAWSLLALTEVLKGAGELNASYNFSAALNGATLTEGQANALTPVTAVTTLDGLQLSLPNALDITRGDGFGRLYYRAALFVDRAAESAPAINQGMEVTRVYYDAACEEDCEPLTSAQLVNGAKIKVKVTLSLPEDSYFVMVEDAIPAGTEILNQQLKTSEQGVDAGGVERYDPNDPFADGWGWWYFRAPQIGDEHIEWSADYLPAGTYVLSYTLIPLQAGEYRVLPAHAWQSFFPDVQGTSAGEIFVIRE